MSNVEMREGFYLAELKEVVELKKKLYGSPLVRRRFEIKDSDYNGQTVFEMTCKAEFYKDFQVSEDIEENLYLLKVKPKRVDIGSMKITNSVMLCTKANVNTDHLKLETVK